MRIVLLILMAIGFAEAAVSGLSWALMYYGSAEPGVAVASAAIAMELKFLLGLMLAAIGGFGASALSTINRLAEAEVGRH